MATNIDAKRVVTGRVRLSYVHLTTPRARQGSTEEPKYGVTLLIPKSDVATMQRIQAAIQAAILEGTASAWGGVRPPQPPIPVYDGDGVRPTGEAFGEECRGHYVMTASSKSRPEVVDINMNPIMQPADIYSGMYARVSIRFFAYLNSGKKGIGCGLGNVQKIEDGEPLAGGASAATDFGGSSAPAWASPAQPGYQPQYQPQQPNPLMPSQSPYLPQQPQYQPVPVQPQQPQYQHQQQPMLDFYSRQPAPAQPPAPQIDPITGKPVSGGILGLGQ